MQYTWLIPEHEICKIKKEKKHRKYHSDNVVQVQALDSSSRLQIRFGSEKNGRDQGEGENMSILVTCRIH